LRGGRSGALCPPDEAISCFYEEQLPCAELDERFARVEKHAIMESLRKRGSMNSRKKINLALSTLLVVLLTIILGLVETNRFSAYGVCRDTALHTKSYAAWEHVHTTQIVFVTRMTFSDGYNELTCQAIGIGPFWTATSTLKTLVGCATSLSDNPTDACPEDYFGVNP
jgi:hypothetical protein